MKRQAVILIHGIGEQMPLQTLRTFVDAVWTRADQSHRDPESVRVWSKPDPLTGNVALPKLVAPGSRWAPPTDFFEFYWAHFMTETKVSHVLAWVRVLLLRWPWNLPPRLRRVWLLLVVVTIAVLGLSVYLHEKVFALPGWSSLLAGLAVSSIVDVLIIHTLGDAARYLHRTAQNTARRVEILTKGIELLREVHDSGRYDRVVVVGHSLGSVIGYDILTYLWTLYHGQLHVGKASESRLPGHAGIEALANQKDVDADTYQEAQRCFREEMRTTGRNWLVTDFVTVGSPLAHAAVLLARDSRELHLRQQDREFPICPPVLDRRRFTFPIQTENADGTSGFVRVPHHAALFGPTRWTNIFFSGDIVGGPLRPVFGPGIRDIPVRIKWWRSFACHNQYWGLAKSEDVSDAVTALRKLLHSTE